MILERLSVRAFGCLRDPVDLRFDERFNIVAGRNEAGKSTLFRALHHALFTPYGSSAQEVRDLQPWGTELSPEVSVEFRIGDERFRLVKSFLNQARCALAEWDGARFRDVVDGDGAEARVRSHLLGERPGSGAAQEKHRGLARLLWIPQGETSLPELEGDVRQRIEQSLDAITLDEGEGRLHAAISRSYADIWAKSGKSFVKSSGLPTLEAEINDLVARRANLVASLRTAEQTSSRLADVEIEIAQLEEEKRETAQEVEALDAEVQRVRELKMRLLKERAALNEVKGRRDRLRQDRERLRTLKAEIRAAEEALVTRIAPKWEQLERALKDAQDRREMSKRALSAAEQRLKDARSAWQRARRLHEAIGCQGEIRRLTRLVGEVESVYEERDAFNERLVHMANPGDAHIKRARTMEAALRQLEGKLDAVGIRVSFVAEQDLCGKVRKDGGEASDISMRAAERLEVAATRSVEWRIEGVGTFAIESGAEEAASLKGERDQTELGLKELLGPFGAASADELFDLRQARSEVEQKKATLEGRAKQLLQDHDSLDALKSGIADLERRVTALSEELGLERGALGSVEPPDLSRFEEAFAAAESEQEDLRQAVDTAVMQVDKVSKHVNALEQERALEAQKRRNAESAIEALLSEYGSENDLVDAYNRTHEQFEECDERVRSITAKLPSDENDPELRAARLKSALAEMDVELRDRSLARAKLQQQLEDIADAGTYEALARVEEDLQLKKDQHERQVRRAKAIKLLKALSDARQEKVIDQLTGPISNRVSRYFEQVSGEMGRRVRFDGKLRPAFMDVDRTEGLSTDALSTGAREQLHILARLALGRYLASTYGRMLFVLDDSLVNTDASRRRRFLDLLLESKAELQVVLLTCHPEWYRGLDGACKLDLDGAV